MDVIHAGPLGVRSAVFELRSKNTPCRFTVYPMIHVGDASFYRAVADRLAGHDLIVGEGIRGPSRITSLITLVYDVGVPVLRPDMTGSEVDQGWRRIRLAEHAMWCAALPVATLYLGLFASRALIARHVHLDDDVLDVEEPNVLELHDLIVDQRDALLCEALTQIHTERCEEDVNVAVVYGASHVPPLVTHLRRHGYVPYPGEWLQVFSL